MNTTELDAAAAAKLLDVSTRRLQQLAKDGWIAPSGRNRYPLVSVVQGYAAYLRDQIGKAARGSDAEARLRNARAREVELRTARLDGTVIDLDEALSATSEMPGLFIACLEGLPARITRDARERTRLQRILRR